MPVSLGDSVREVTGGAVGTCPGVETALQNNSRQGPLAKRAPAAKGPQGSDLLGQREPWPLQRLSPTSPYRSRQRLDVQPCSQGGAPGCHACAQQVAHLNLWVPRAWVWRGTPFFRVVPSLQTCACYRGWGSKRALPSVQPRPVPGEAHTTGQLPGWL